MALIVSTGRPSETQDPTNLLHAFALRNVVSAFSTFVKVSLLSSISVVSWRLKVAMIA